jgi:hypothetical protein
LKKGRALLKRGGGSRGDVETGARHRRRRADRTEAELQKNLEQKQGARQQAKNSYRQKNNTGK